MHCKVCMHLYKLWNMHFLHWLLVLFTCIWYAAFSFNVSLIHNQSRTARQSCKTMHVTQLYVNHQCSNQAPNQLQISVGTASDQKTDATQLVYTLPIPSLAKKLHKQYNLYSATIWSGQEIDYTQAFPNCGRYPSRNSRACSQACPVFHSSVLRAVDQ